MHWSAEKDSFYGSGFVCLFVFGWLAGWLAGWFGLVWFGLVWFSNLTSLHGSACIAKR